MSEIIYTAFGYGKIITADPLNGLEPLLTKEKSMLTPLDEPEVNPAEISETADDGDVIYKVDFRWGGQGYLPVGFGHQASCIKRKIKLKVKTMFASRKTFELEMSITSNITEIYAELTKLIGSEVMENLSNPKFYCSMVVARSQGSNHLSDIAYTTTARIQHQRKRTADYDGSDQLGVEVEQQRPAGRNDSTLG